jgi:hypothetical protein
MVNWAAVVAFAFFTVASLIYLATGDMPLSIQNVGFMWLAVAFVRRPSC